MGAIADMTHNGEVYSDGFDGIVIRRLGGSITGGRTLDFSGFAADWVRAGHVVIHETVTDTYKPLGVADGAYEALPEGHTYAGVTITSVSKRKPFAAIMYDGEVNDKAMPYPLTDAMRKAIKETFPSLYFMHD